MDFYGHIIDGREVPSIDGATMPDVDPYTREAWATIACGSAADADAAVAAARRAFDDGPWPRMGFEKRQVILHRLADLMDQHAGELALADTRDMGKPITQARGDVARSSWNVRFFADHARLAVSEAYPMDTGHHAYTRFDPVGVAVAISPWNFPLMLGTWKVAPALAWGNTVVMKPAEDTPVSATIWARLALEAGVPPGVLNIVHGYGPDSAGAALTSNPDVDRITFTGESGTGKGHQRSGGEEPRARQPRTRRQGREHRVRRCRPGQRGRVGRAGDLPQRRPDLPVRITPVPAGRHLRRVPGPIRRGRRGDARGRPAGSDDRVPTRPAPATSTSPRSAATSTPWRQMAGAS